MSSFNGIGEIRQLSTKDTLLNQLQELEKLSKDFFENVMKGYVQKGTCVTNPVSITKIADDIVVKDAQIKASVKKALVQVEKNEEINKVKDELTKIENELLLLQSSLKEAENLLATALFQASKKLEASEQAKKASIQCEELIKFAFRISSGNSVEAPPDWIPGDPRRPYPLDIEMRCGALGQLSQKLPQVSIDQQSGSIAEPNNSLLGMNEQVKDQNNIQETLLAGDNLHAVNDSLGTTSKNGNGIWQGPPAEDFAHLATMPVSAMMSNPAIPTNDLNGGANVDDVGYMSTSSDSSSSGESA